jgi:glycosyltransferase 2 family protein
VLGMGISAVSTVACSWRWRLLARELAVDLPVWTAVAACYRAQFLNTVLPGGVLGDVHRGVVHARETGETGRSLRAVGWERFAGQVVQAAVAVCVLALVPSPARPLVPWLLLGLAVTGAAVTVLVVPVPELDTWWSRAARVVRDDVRTALLVRRAWPGVVAASLVALAGHVTTYVLAARAVGVAAPVTTLIPLALAVLVVAGVPVNLAGWGPREGMAAWAFAAAGLGAGTGLATAVAFGAMVLVANLPGALVLIGWRSRERRPDLVTEGGLHA